MVCIFPVTTALMATFVGDFVAFAAAAGDAVLSADTGGGASERMSSVAISLFMTFIFDTFGMLVMSASSAWSGAWSGAWRL